MPYLAPWPLFCNKTASWRVVNITEREAAPAKAEQLSAVSLSDRYGFIKKTDKKAKRYAREANHEFFARAKAPFGVVSRYARFQ